MIPDPLNPPGPPTGLPEEPNPIDPSPNEDVLDPTIPRDTGDPETEPLVTPGYGTPAPEPSY